MVWVNTITMTVLDIKDYGQTMRKMVKVPFSMLMETNTLVTGKTVTRTNKEFTTLLMVTVMKEIG